MWVFLRYTEVVNLFPSLLTNTSRKAICLSTSSSMVNCMALCWLLRCFQGFLTVGPEDKGVIHVPPPDLGFQWGRAQGLLLKVFHIDASYDGRQGSPWQHPLFVHTTGVVSSTGIEVLSISISSSFSRCLITFRASSMGTRVKRFTSSKLTIRSPSSISIVCASLAK